MTTESSTFLLLHFSGKDRAGLTADLAHVLAAHEVNLLDIGQSIVHEELALGILVTVPANKDLDALKATLREHAHELGLEPGFSTVTADEVMHWRGTQLRPRWAITLLAPTITAQHLARVGAILAEHAYNMLRMEPLTSPSAQVAEASTSVADHPADHHKFAVLAITASGEPERMEALRKELRAAGEELGFDVVLERDGLFRRNRRLFVFDMDSTLIQGEVIDELARLAGVGEQVSAITASAMRGELDFDQSFTRRLGLLAGLDATRAHGLIDQIPLMPGTERLFATLRRLGVKTAILSGGFTFFARHLQQRLGIDFVHANELQVHDGRLTGQVVPPIVNGARKAALLTEIAEREGFTQEQIVAVGDGANDIPMLKLAGMGVAYHAKPRVREMADHAISTVGLDGLLYLLGLHDRDLEPQP